MASVRGVARCCGYTAKENRNRQDIRSENENDISQSDASFIQGKNAQNTRKYQVVTAPSSIGGRRVLLLSAVLMMLMACLMNSIGMRAHYLSPDGKRSGKCVELRLGQLVIEEARVEEVVPLSGSRFHAVVTQHRCEEVTDELVVNACVRVVDRLSNDVECLRNLARRATCFNNTCVRVGLWLDAMLTLGIRHFVPVSQCQGEAVVAAQRVDDNGQRVVGRLHLERYQALIRLNRCIHIASVTTTHDDFVEQRDLVREDQVHQESKSVPFLAHDQ